VGPPQVCNFALELLDPGQLLGCGSCFEPLVAAVLADPGRDRRLGHPQILRDRRGASTSLGDLLDRTSTDFVRVAVRRSHAASFPWRKAKAKRLHQTRGDSEVQSEDSRMTGDRQLPGRTSRW